MGVAKIESPFENARSATGWGPTAIICMHIGLFCCRWLYWGSWDAADQQKLRAVFRTSMDGSSTTTILGSNLVSWPQGLALDFANNVLYLADANNDTLIRANTDGTEFQVRQALPLSLPSYLPLLSTHFILFSLFLPSFWAPFPFPHSRGTLVIPPSLISQLFSSGHPRTEQCYYYSESRFRGRILR